MRRAQSVLAAIGAGCLLAGACSTSTPVDEGNSGTIPAGTTPRGSLRPGTTLGTMPASSHREELVLGVLVPESGEYEAIAPSMLAPVQLAVDQINAAGGVNGVPVRIVTADGSDAETAAESIARLSAEDEVSAIIGPVDSLTAIEVMDAIATARVPVCSGSNTASRLSDLDSGGNYFRTSPSDSLQAAALAQLTQIGGRTNVAVLARDDEFGDQFADDYEEALDALGGGTAVGARVSYDPDGDVAQAVTEALDADPDGIILIARPADGAKVVQELESQGAGHTIMPLYTIDTLQDPGFADLVDPDNPNMVSNITGTALPIEARRIDSPFNEAFEQVTVKDQPVANVFSAYYWDCTNLLALAAVSAGDAGPDAIRSGFGELLAGDEDCEDASTCIELLEAGDTIHYRGASSSFDEWDENEPGAANYDLWTFAEDGTVIIETEQVPS